MLTIDQVEKLQELIRAGLPVSQIAKKLGISRSRVYEEIRKMEEESRGEPRGPVRDKAPVGSVPWFRERGLRIALGERINAVIRKAEAAPEEEDLDPAEEEQLRVLVRRCQDGVAHFSSFSMEDAEVVTREVETVLARITGQRSARAELEDRVRTRRMELKQLERACEEGNARVQELEGARVRKAAELAGLTEQVGAKARALGLAADIESLVRERGNLSRQVEEMKRVHGLQGTEAALLAEIRQHEARLAALNAEVEKYQLLVIAILDGERGDLLDRLRSLPPWRLRTVSEALVLAQLSKAG